MIAHMYQLIYSDPRQNMYQCLFNLTPARALMQCLLRKGSKILNQWIPLALMYQMKKCYTITTSKHC